MRVTCHLQKLNPQDNHNAYAAQGLITKLMILENKIAKIKDSKLYPLEICTHTVYHMHTGTYIHPDRIHILYVLTLLQLVLHSYVYIIITDCGFILIPQGLYSNDHDQKGIALEYKCHSPFKET